MRMPCAVAACFGLTEAHLAGQGCSLQVVAFLHHETATECTVSVLCTDNIEHGVTSYLMRVLAGPL